MRPPSWRRSAGTLGVGELDDDAAGAVGAAAEVDVADRARAGRGSGRRAVAAAAAPRRTPRQLLAPRPPPPSVTTTLLPSTRVW